MLVGGSPIPPVLGRFLSSHPADYRWLGSSSGPRLAQRRISGYLFGWATGYHFKVDVSLES